MTNRAFLGLSKQNLTCYQAIRELVDNAIAARKKGKKASVWICMAADVEDKNYMWLVIADWGLGMDLQALENALQLGSIPTGDDRLNEHGFGIDNALVLPDRRQGRQAGRSIPTSCPALTIKSAGLLIPACWPPKPRPSTCRTAASSVGRIPPPSMCCAFPLCVAQTLQYRGGKCTDMVTLRSWLVEHLAWLTAGISTWTRSQWTRRQKS